MFSYSGGGSDIALRNNRAGGGSLERGRNNGFLRPAGNTGGGPADTEDRGMGKSGRVFFFGESFLVFITLLLILFLLFLFWKDFFSEILF